VVNNVFGTPKVDLPLTFNAGQWYDVKVIFDRITGVIDVYWNNYKIATWTDTSPHTVGDYISFRSGNSKMSIDEIKVYRSRPNTVTVTVGPGSQNEIRYQNPNPTTPAAKIKSIAQDSAGNLSPIYYHDLNVDWTPPLNLVFINDGKGPDVQTVPLSDSLSANWSASSDPNSGINAYYYCIGTSPGSQNILNWTPSWPFTSVTVHSLSLQNNTTYYFSVYAENGAGLLSNTLTSNGQTTDSTLQFLNSVPFVSSAQVKIFPNPVSQNRIFISGLPDDTETILILDMQGKIIRIYQPDQLMKNENNHVLTLPEANGNYILLIKTSKQLYKEKLIRQ
jgi:hypothetical protein